ncbi:Hypothetical predicted protein [Pelobates cultripes]|uniref:Uncharacterized protein n=1 Tax=Pelobates cultripes TaxID=61616 RepID=A0AAD1RFX6_PELCU|nr:Hypothetical predicted protein [Pelobates cultripes]
MRSRQESGSSESEDNSDVQFFSDEEEEEIDHSSRSLDSRSVEKLISLLRNTLRIPEDKAESLGGYLDIVLADGADSQCPAIVHYGFKLNLCRYSELA